MRRRHMSLTPELVALCERPESRPPPDSRFTPIGPAELDVLSERLLEQLGDQALWLFAYGSLIWKPDFTFVEQRRGTVHGWHRSFCLEVTSWRGTPQQPGIMMALAKGGCCDGLAFRLPDGEHREDIRRLVGREITEGEEVSMVRWVTVRTEAGPIRALAFWVGPKGEGVALRLPLERVAWILARAAGHGGSGASYLYNTVSKLDEFGVRDRNLWSLQDLVAREISELYAK